MYLQGLFKARKLLSEDFGNVHVHFGEPLSIRKFTDGKVDRSVHSLVPRYNNHLVYNLRDSFNIKIIRTLFLNCQKVVYIFQKFKLLTYLVYVYITLKSSGEQPYNT